MEKKPSSIHSRKEHKLTRRRLFKTLVGGGVAPVAASRITVDDVKAADSDQIPIALDTEGKIKRNVPADWYDRLAQARKVREKLSEEKRSKPTILGVGVAAGQRGGDNPSLIVHHDKKKEDKAQASIERENEINGIEINHYDVINQQPDSCNTGVCDDYDCTPLPDGEPIPGGATCDIIHPDSDWCSHTSRILDENFTYDNSWLTAAHCTPSCDTANNTPVYHQNYSDHEEMGEIVEVYPEYDVAVVTSTDRDASKEIAESSDLNNGDRYPIEHTITKDDLDFWANEQRLVFQYGGGTCYNEGIVDHITQDYHLGEAYCADVLKESVHLQMDSGGGDSGSGSFCYYDEENTYFGVSIHSGSYQRFFWEDISYGTPGYKVRSDLGYYWR